MSEYTSWYVGMKVVCIKDGAWQLAGGFVDREVIFPLAGAVYTILAIGAVGDEVYVKLVECGDYAQFAAFRFRPVQPRKTDISIFHSILNGHRISEDA